MSRNTIMGSGHFRLAEHKAGGAITAGHLIERAPNKEVVVHSTSVGRAARLFAFEDSTQGKTVDGVYASGERVRYGAVAVGSTVMAKLATSQTIVEGDILVSNGDGTLKKAAASTDFAVAVADEAVTTTGTVKPIEVIVA